MKMKSGLFVLASLSLLTLISSCGGEDSPAPPTVEFQSAIKSVGESAGIVEITIELNKAAPQAITVRYALSGTAIEGTTSSADYKVVGKYGEIEIDKGEASGSIQLEIKQDALVEGNETIIITLDEVVSNKAKIGTLNQTIVTIESDDVGAKVSFASATQSFSEDDGVVEIQLVLDKAAEQDVTVSYEFNYDLEAPTALDSVFAFDNEVPSRYYDFYVTEGEYGQVTIAQGETTGTIMFQLLSDFWFEDDEVIEIDLTSASGGGQLGSLTKTTVTLVQENGKILALFWDESYTDVDMDLFLWLGDTPSTDPTDYFGLVGSTSAAYTPQLELLFIPDVIENGGFGISCNYYEGSEDPMNFEMQYIDYVDGVLEGAADRELFEGTYTIANINRYDQTNEDPIIVQTFKKVAGEFTDFTDIMVPSSGSRIKGNSRSKFAIPTKNRSGNTTREL